VLALALAQVAYNALFNPALPKNSSGDGMPLMLRNVKGVTDFQLSFLQDKEGVFKTTCVYARLSGVPFEIECRSCSYCGSCFSGRFMELDSTHQRAGGWKEITEKIHAGNFSWKGLKGCVAPAHPLAPTPTAPFPAPPTPPIHTVPLLELLSTGLREPEAYPWVFLKVAALRAMLHQLRAEGNHGKHKPAQHRQGSDSCMQHACPMKSLPCMMLGSVMCCHIGRSRQGLFGCLLRTRD
jgi:hypothetical protein